MAGPAVALPAVLAGPILQRITPTNATLFLATSVPLKFNKLAAQVWDPLPDGLAGYLPAPDPVAGLAGGLRAPLNVESRTIGKELFVHRIVLDAERSGWPANRALAYRVAPSGTDWLPPPGGSHTLPRDPDAVHARGTPTPPRTPFPHAWFALDPLSIRWSVLSLHGEATATWVEADTYLARLARGSQPRSPGAPNLRGANVEPGRPTTAITFAIDAIPSDADAVSILVGRLASDLETNLATALCGYLLAFSPDLWGVVAALRMATGVTPRAPAATAVTQARAAAFARLAAHVPLYGLPSWTFSRPGVNSIVRDAAIRAFSICFGWGNRGDDPTPPSVGVFNAVTEYLTGAPPELKASFFTPDFVPHPRESSATPDARVFQFFVVATPTPLLPLVPPAGHSPPRLGAYDNLFVLSPDTVGYVATPKGQPDDGDTPRPRDPRAFTTQAARRLYQLTIAPSVRPGAPHAMRTGKAITWNSTRMKYADGARAEVLAAAPTFGILASETTGTKMGYRLALFTDAAHGIGVLLQRNGHRVMPMGTSDIFIGNRFRTTPENDDLKLGGIDVHVDGVQLATTDPDGLARGVLARLTDGQHTLATLGALTQPGPPGPNTAPSGPRLWRQREFQVRVQDHQIVRVDDEFVASPGVRILIDPVWMQLRSGVRLVRPNRGQPVSLFIVHRPEQPDARASLRTWQKTAAQRLADGEAANHVNTAVHYVLARDGTLIKMEADTKVVNHAPGHWGELTTGTPPVAVSTQDSAVGVEISKAHDEANPYTSAQYDHLLWLLGQYVATAGLHPLDIVGHSDVQDEGRDDPGLTFEWSRLEAAGFGIRPPNRLEHDRAVLLTPLPDFPLDWSNVRPQQIRQPTGEWRAQLIVTNLLDFSTLFATELAKPHPRDEVDSRVRDLIRSIGYHQNLRLTGPGLGNALQSFRSHFFSGPRRGLFKLRRAGVAERLVEREDGSLVDDDIWQITAVWARRVADFVTTARATPTPPPAQPLPPAPR